MTKERITSCVFTTYLRHTFMRTINIQVNSNKGSIRYVSEIWCNKLPDDT